MALLCKHHLDDSCCFPDFIRIVRRFLTDARLAFLQLIGDLGTRDRFNAQVLHSSDQLFLFHDKGDDITGFPRLLFNANIIKVPEGIKRFDVTANDILVKRVTRFCLKIVLDRFSWNPVIAANPNLFDAIPIGALQRLWLYTGEG